jgi:hypothetical protein
VWPGEEGEGGEEGGEIGGRRRRRGRQRGGRRRGDRRSEEKGKIRIVIRGRNEREVWRAEGKIGR